jgi:hypothetical protein
MSPSSASFRPSESASVGQILVGEQRVAAVGWHLEGEEHAAHGRLRQIRRVRVPHTPEVVALVLEFHDGGDQRRLGKPGQIRVLHRFAETPGEGHLVLGSRLLVAQEDDEVVQKRLAHLPDDLLIEIARHVDADDLGPQGSRQWTNLDMSVASHRPR